MTPTPHRGPPYYTLEPTQNIVNSRENTPTHPQRSRYTTPRMTRPAQNQRRLSKSAEFSPGWLWISAKRRRCWAFPAISSMSTSATSCAGCGWAGGSLWLWLSWSAGLTAVLRWRSTMRHDTRAYRLAERVTRGKPLQAQGCTPAAPQWFGLRLPGLGLPAGTPRERPRREACEFKRRCLKACYRDRPLPGVGIGLRFSERDFSHFFAERLKNGPSF